MTALAFALTLLLGATAPADPPADPPAASVAAEPSAPQHGLEASPERPTSPAVHGPMLPRPAMPPLTPRQRYDAAVERLLAGEAAGAAADLEALAADPDAGALALTAGEVASLAREVARRGGLTLSGAPAAAGSPAARPRLDRSGRAELALYQTFYGAGVGASLAGLIGVEDSRAFIAFTLAGSATGLTLSLTTTRDQPMPAGRADAINTAATWGTFNGSLGGAVLGLEGRGLLASSLAGGLGALFVTAGATRDRPPALGDVALVNSGGIWGAVSGGLLLATVDTTGRAAATVVLLTGDAGLIVGALLARRYQLSRGHALVIDAGGVLGLLAGLALPAMAGAEGGGTYGIAGLLGLAAGLGTAAAMSRDWDDQAEAATAAAGSVGPATIRLQGGGLAYGLAGRF